MDGPDLFWGPWIIWPVLFWITLFWLMKLGVSRRAHFRHRNRDSAEGILRERFARGEITADEYERALGVLRGGTARRTYGEEQQPGEREG